MIYITYPCEGTKVALNQTVGGFIVGKYIPMQVYILSHDDKWYLQEPTEFLSMANETRNWSCDCVFGDVDTPSGSRFVVGVVASAERPHSPVEFVEHLVDQIYVERL